MRKLKLQVQISVDGFISGLNGEMDWMTNNWDNDLNKYVTEISETVDCIILGRKLAQGFIPYWASKPEGEDSFGVDKMNNTKKVIFTKTLDKSEWDNTVLAKGDLVEEINKLKKQDGKDLIAYGGGTFVTALIKQGLVDEFHLFINPIAIGNGMTIFKGLEFNQKYKLLKSKSFECGIVVINYELDKS